MSAGGAERLFYMGGRRSVSARFDVIRNGSKFAELYPIGLPVVRMDDRGIIKTALTGDFYGDSRADFLTDRIRPYLVIDGEPYPVGEFLVGTATQKRDGTSRTVSLECYDQTLLFKQSALIQMESIPAGRSYTGYLKEKLVEHGVTRLICEDAQETIGVIREDWDVGTPWITVINTLLREINYHDLWFDLDGSARLEARRAPTALGVKHSYHSGAYSVISGAHTSTLDAYGAANVFTVMVSNPDSETPMIATSVNNSMDNPLSTVRRGRRIMAPIRKLDQIASQEQLQRYADQLKFESMLASETVTFETAAVPLHGVGDIVALESGALSGIYLETGWSMELGAGGRMRHTARRIFYR